jgi:Glycosyltransferase family 87
MPLPDTADTATGAHPLARIEWMRGAWAVAIVAAVAPLWFTPILPLVDLPQHLHLISVLHRLGDPTTLYPRLFEARGELTPYLGYYHAVSLLHWLLPLELSNKVFLTAYVAGLPMAMAFLLRSLGRPTWPALLSAPFAYGDSFGWGFINYCSALPLTLVAAGCFVRAIADATRRWRWAAGLGVSLVAALLFHVQAFVYLAVALPFLLLTTRAPEDARPRHTGDNALDRLLRPRLPALAGVLPGIALFIAWFGGRLARPAEIAPGEPWKAWGPIFSPQNLAWKSTEQNWSDLPRVLANLLRDGSDRYALYAVVLVALASVAAAAVARLWKSPAPGADSSVGSSRDAHPVERWRMLGLAAIALALYFLLPFDVRGYVYYLNTRYAHLAAPLLLASIPIVRGHAARALAVAAAACSVVLAVPLASAFEEFGREAAPLIRLAGATADRPMVMGLVFDPSSRVVTHPVFLHSAAVIARERGGATNFSFASTPHSPLRYRGAPPPTFRSEWNPAEFSLEAHGYAYDHFLVRGVDPSRIFGAALHSELFLGAEDDGFFLVRRRGGR